MCSERDWGRDLAAHSHVIPWGRGITAAKAAASNTTPAGCLLPLTPASLQNIHIHTFSGSSPEKCKIKKLRRRHLKSPLKIQLQKQPRQWFPYSRTPSKPALSQSPLLHLSAPHPCFLPLLSSGTHPSVWHFVFNSCDLDHPPLPDW